MKRTYLMMRYVPFVLLIFLVACGPRTLEPANTPIPLTPTPADTFTDPNDTDGDGVINADDRCPGTITGASGADQAGCPDQFDPYINLAYNHQAHESWYRRFWTGDCEGVPGFCLPGEPAWLNITQTASDAFPPDEQGVIRNRLWAIGRAVGFDWASDPDINTDKQVTTNRLRQWGNQLQNTDDFVAALTALEGEVCDLLGADALEGDLSPAASCQP